MSYDEQRESVRIREERAHNEEIRKWIRFGLAAGVVSVAVVIGIVFSYKLINARVQLSQASNTKKIQIEDARGKAEAATLLADAEVERAKGVAQANEIIADSLTDEYIRWLYVDQLDQTNGQIIYIPTEAGLPILEAGNR